MCLFLLSVKFFMQISKWFLGPIDVNEWVFFHVKWYPQGWGRAGFFPCVRWSNEWLPTCSRSWSPKPACPLGAPRPHLYPYWDKIVLVVMSEIFAVVWSCFLCRFSKSAPHQRMLIPFPLAEVSMFWVFPSLNCHFPPLQEQGVHLIYIKASTWHDIVVLVQFVLTVSRLRSSIAVNSVWFLSLSKTLCGDKP